MCVCVYIYIERERERERLLCQNLMVTANQKCTIDAKKKKQFKHNPKDSHQITKEENKRGREARRLDQKILHYEGLSWVW